MIPDKQGSWVVFDSMILTHESRSVELLRVKFYSGSHKRSQRQPKLIKPNK